MISENVDHKTVAGFGDEWSRFTQADMSAEEKERIFQSYFSIFPWERIDRQSSVGADIGCGSGRWATLVAPRVKILHALDASAAALKVARSNLSRLSNVEFHEATVSEMPFEDGSLDFAYSLGVLHHLPDTRRAITDIARKLKPGSPFLIYLYYSFDNQPAWYRSLWKASELGRAVISRSPNPVRYGLSQAIAAGVYWPLARAARFAEKFHSVPSSWPLGAYRDKSFYVMRTDALDRFGTRLEQRFSRKQIKAMLEAAGFEGIRFSERAPFWCAVGFKNGRA